MPNKPRPKVIVTRRLPQAVETRMAELFDVELNLTDTPFTQEQLCTAARNCDVLVPTVTDHVDAAVFAAAAPGPRPRRRRRLRRRRASWQATEGARPTPG